MKKAKGKEENINWHAGFVAALKLTFADYADALKFSDEVQLNTNPLRMDAVIIKKKPEAVITKKLAAVFKTANILEYKNPDVYLSVDDFNRALAYCFLYSSINSIFIGEVSLSLVVGQHPGTVLKYIRETCTWEVEEIQAGVHVVKDLPFGIQLIERGKVEGNEWDWVRDLHHQHRGESLKRVFEKSLGYKGEESVKVYVDILARANLQGMKEITEMARETLEEVLTAAGLTAVWETRGRMEGRAEGEARGEARGEAKGMKEALEMLRSGRSLEELERICQERERRLTKTTNNG